MRVSNWTRKKRKANEQKREDREKRKESKEEKDRMIKQGKKWTHTGLIIHRQ